MPSQGNEIMQTISDEAAEAGAKAIREYVAKVEVESNGEKHVDPMFFSCDLASAALTAALPHLQAQEPTETMRKFIDRQGEKVRTMEGSISWRNGYGAALDNMNRMLDALFPAAPQALVAEKSEVK